MMILGRMGDEERHTCRLGMLDSDLVWSSDDRTVAGVGWDDDRICVPMPVLLVCLC